MGFIKQFSCSRVSHERKARAKKIKIIQAMLNWNSKKRLGGRDMWGGRGNVLIQSWQQNNLSNTTSTSLLLPFNLAQYVVSVVCIIDTEGTMNLSICLLNNEISLQYCCFLHYTEGTDIPSGTASKNSCNNTGTAASRTFMQEKCTSSRFVPYMNYNTSVTFREKPFSNWNVIC